MKLAPSHEFNARQREAMRRAQWLEYATLLYLLSVVGLMFAVMGEHDMVGEQVGDHHLADDYERRRHA